MTNITMTVAESRSGIAEALEIGPSRETRTGLLIATDGRAEADAAVIIGQSLAVRDNEPAELLMVRALDDDAERRNADDRRLAEQRARTTNFTREEWPLSIAYGRRGATIAEMAEAGRQRLIVMGLYEHARHDRWLGRDTVLEVVREADRPVLAVNEHSRTIPRRAMVATDFGASSLAAARETVRLLGRSGELYLTHVAPRVPVPFDSDSTGSFQRTPEQMLAAMQGSLGIPRGVETHLVLLRGNPVDEMLAFAYERGIELIAAGSRGRSLAGGPAIGAVPASLLRAAQASVLVVPPRMGR
jgi:nucleotide-binding universal stress UspA family protein